MSKKKDTFQQAASMVAAITEMDLPTGVYDGLMKRLAAKKKAQEAAQGKNPAAVALGRLGGLKGGDARAAVLTPEQRKAIAQKAALARWGNPEEREARNARVEAAGKRLGGKIAAKKKASK